MCILNHLHYHVIAEESKHLRCPLFKKSAVIRPKYDISYLKKIKEDKKINSNKVEVLINLIKEIRYLNINTYGK